MAQGPAEYVVRLGTSIDNNGLDQIINFFDTFRKSGLGIAAAVTGATTALYKFIESTTKQEFELRKLAKAQGKSVEEMTKQDAVLKAMGKSLEEVRKDDKLKKTYEEIMKFNKELELPSASGSLKKIEELRAGFWKLKSIVGIAVSSIGKQLLINLEEPIKRITGGMDKVSDWVRTQLNSISSKVSSVLTAFAKGIMGIGSVFSRIFSWIQSLPAGIKAIAVAIGALGLALSTGPIGQILLAISAIGDLIHDYDNYKWNQQNAKDTKFWAADNEKGWTANKNEALKDANGNAIAYKVPLFLEPAWEGYEQEGVGGVVKALAKKITEGLGDIDAESLGDGLGDFITGIFTQLSGALDGSESGGVFGAIGDAAKTFGIKLFEFISHTLEKIDIAQIGSSLASIAKSLFGVLSNILTSAFGIASAEENNGELGTAIGNVVTQLLSGIFNFVTDFSSSPEVLGFVENLFNGISDAVSSLGQMLGQVVGNILGWIFSADGAQAIFDAGESFINLLIKGMQYGVSTAVNLLGSIIDGILIGLGVIDPNEKNSYTNQVKKVSGEKNALRSVLETADLSDATEYENAALAAIFGSEYAGNISENDKNYFGDYLRQKAMSSGAVATDLPFGQGTNFATIMNGASSNTQVYDAFVDMTRGVMTMVEEERSKALGEGKEFTGENVKALLGGLFKVAGVNPDALSGDFYDQFANWQVNGGIENESAVLTSLISKIYGKEYGKETDEKAKKDQYKKAYEESGLGSSSKQAASDMKTAGEGASALASATESAAARINSVNIGGESEGGGMALGGRFGKRTNVTLGEDGTEYIIPITKPARAAALLKQMFGEMGGAAVSRITKDLGLGIPGTNGAGGGSMSSALSGMQMANTYTINAPVTINVQSSGADAREIGARVYDLAERNLIKNLVGVNG